MDIQIVLNTLLALALGWLVGYERYFQGRASGSQVYCLVCVASCALATIFGSGSNVVGNILTGIGFLGAGIIVKNGVSIRGLTTAALVWSSSAMGILVGLGHRPAAAFLALLFIFCTVVMPRLEGRLPSRKVLAVQIQYAAGARPDAGLVRHFLHEHGLSIHAESLAVRYEDGRHHLDFIIVADRRRNERTLIETISAELSGLPNLDSFSIARTTWA
ncbi:MgtC/SapB family protein [Lysobacter enzymogenes]|uniref:MgtC/SapB family protein n=1 Tax=Lysobacter enzymogenes TaxID=69 RepID=UPI0009D45D40|nr:MgtC/SapB family protein [Lysobacter enzymogenes]UZW62181.1 MgtC/SapB family protein [Lysobacter enzymogenes]